MEALSVSGRPVTPDSEVLPESTITAAGYIGEDAIVQERLELLFRPNLDGDLDAILVDLTDGDGKSETRELSRIVVRDHHASGGDTVERLVDEHVASFRVAVVGDEETGRDRAEGILGRRSERVEGFEELDRLGSGCSAHVEDLENKGVSRRFGLRGESTHVVVG